MNHDAPGEPLLCYTTRNEVPSSIYLALSWGHHKDMKPMYVHIVVGEYLPGQPEEG